MPTEFPMQPLVTDEDGVVRFKQNRIVQYLLDSGHVDLNALARHVAHGLFDPWEWEQLNQLIGYSVSGFGDGNHRPETVQEADAAVEQLRETRQS